MSYKELSSLIAIVLTLAAFYPYLRSISFGVTKPHVFSWIIWGLSTMIIFFAQFNAGGGVGAWPIGLSGLITIYIAALAYSKKSDISITPLDYFFLIAALMAIPIWILTANPFWAVVLVTTIDLCGFGPTLRKAYKHPDEENISFYFLFFIRCIFVVMALETYSLTTVLFPSSVGITSFVLVVLLYLRKPSSRMQ